MLFRSVADAYVRGGSYAANNFGASQTIDLMEDPNTNNLRRGYLRFDVRGVTNALKVVLSLVPTVVASPMPTLNIAVLTNDVWTESGITWNNQPTESGVIVATMTNFVVNTPVETDLTSAVQNAAASDGWLSLRISVTAAASLSFGSREQSEITNRPALLVANTATFAMTVKIVNNAMQFTWPASYQTPNLLVQTNAAGVGLGTNWTDWGMVPNPLLLPIVGNNGSVFYRLKIP